MKPAGLLWRAIILSAMVLALSACFTNNGQPEIILESQLTVEATSTVTITGTVNQIHRTRNIEWTQSVDDEIQVEFQESEQPGGKISMTFVAPDVSVSTDLHFTLGGFDDLFQTLEKSIRVTVVPAGSPCIVIDGNTTDWLDIPVALTDPADVPDSSGPDWLTIQVTNDNNSLYIRATSENEFNLSGAPAFSSSRTLIFFDVDNNDNTGYFINGIGADLAIWGDALYGLATLEAFIETFYELANVAPLDATTDVEWSIPLSYITELNPPQNQISILFQNDEVGDFAPDTEPLVYTLITQ